MQRNFVPRRAPGPSRALATGSVREARPFVSSRAGPNAPARESRFAFGAVRHRVGGGRPAAGFGEPQAPCFEPQGLAAPSAQDSVGPGRRQTCELPDVATAVRKDGS